MPHLMTAGGDAACSSHLVRADVASILAEYREMPCLRLTLRQAARFFNLEEARCARALDWLVDVGVLSTNGLTYARRDVGRRPL